MNVVDTIIYNIREDNLSKAIALFMVITLASAVFYFLRGTKRREIKAFLTTREKRFDYWKALRIPGGFALLVSGGIIGETFGQGHRVLGAVVFLAFNLVGFWCFWPYWGQTGNKKQ
jgi:hypothetical protein